MWVVTMDKEEIIQSLEDALDRVTFLKQNANILSFRTKSEVFTDIINWANKTEEKIIEYENRIDHGEDPNKIYSEFISNYIEPTFKVSKDNALFLLSIYDFRGGMDETLY